MNNSICFNFVRINFLSFLKKREENKKYNLCLTIRHVKTGQIQLNEPSLGMTCA